MAGRGDGEDVPPPVQRGKGFRDLREKGGDNLPAQRFKDLPIGFHPNGKCPARDIGVDAEEAVFEGYADDGGDGLFIGHRVVHPAHRLLVGADDELVGIGQGAVEIEDDEFDHRTEELISKDTLFSGEMYAFWAIWATFAV